VSKLILANGCSHTAGSECTTSWGNEISKKLNGNLMNISQPGGSNHRIMRTTIEWIQARTVKPDLVLIGWTTHERFEITWRGKRIDYTLDKRSDDPDIERMYRFFDLNVADWDIGVDNTMLYQYNLQLFLKAFDIPYVFCNMFNSIPKGLTSPIWQAIDKSRYVEPYSSFIEKYRELYPDMFSETVHATEPFIHECIANDIMKEIDFE